MIYWIATLGIFVWNLPFGYWRLDKKKYSLSWFSAIHIPVIMIIFFRILSGMGFQLITFPLFIGAFIVGQFIGGRIYQWRKIRSKIPLTACLVWDLISEHKSKLN
jgi:Kef-type K+ transport system membrane component KefB